MAKRKYIKACPFLRDLGDSYLCVNNDKVADVLLDPLLNIEWSEELPPVASEVEDQETCLFVLEIEEDNKLFCISRDMYLKMDNRIILWDDIRDSVYLLDLDSESDSQDLQIDFCSTCLYKVLIASSPAFQSRLKYDEKVKLGSSYILNKANEIYKSIVILSEATVLDDSMNGDKCQNADKELKDDKSKELISVLNWLAWIMEEKKEVNEIFASSIFEWLQKFDEWGLIIKKIPKAENNDQLIKYIQESFDFAARIKELSFEIIMKLSFFETNEKRLQKQVDKINKIISVASIQFEDYMFICKQFFDILNEK